MDEEFKIALLNNSKASFDDVRGLLEESLLKLDSQIDIFVVAYTDNDEIIACAGLYRNIIKCVAIKPEYKGKALSTRLISEITLYAADRGIFHLFLYTKPENINFFKGCCFYPLVTVPNLITLMENTPIGIRSYCSTLAESRKRGDKIGSIVMNANPFTLGHRYLVETAAKETDWVHLFVVSEDASMFPFNERLALIQQGVQGIDNVTVHAGSEYIISKATFPSYFLKEQGKIDQAFTAIDLLLFRQYIAPSLGITHRFVASEPFCKVTKKYNEDMKHWLEEYQYPSPAIEVVEIERKKVNGTPISATRVRDLLKEHDFLHIEELVPDTTLSFLKDKYTVKEIS